MIESPLESTPSLGERTPRRQLFGQVRIERAQARSQDPAIGLREEHSHPTTKISELIAMSVCDFHDQALALEPAQIIRRLAGAVGCGTQPANPLHHLTVAETRDQMTEPDQSRQHRHHPCFTETQSCGMKTVIRF